MVWRPSIRTPYGIHIGRMNKIYKMLTHAGTILGCHQRADRSFFIKGHQFPVCARCTGVFIGECSAVILFRVLKLPTIFLFGFCAIMFFDWLLQFLNILESTNGRRFVTGTLCGYAVGTFYIHGLILLKRFLLSVP